jgi:hypothetical protein
MRHPWVPFVLVACVSSCARERMASRAQCDKLRDRYIDLQLSSLPAARAMTPEARAALRGKLALEALLGPQAARLDERCEARVSEARYKCAVAAVTLEVWQTCME